MKKFKVTMVGTLIKEVFVSAKDKATAIEKVEKSYMDDEKINFTEDDIKQLRMTGKEIISKRREWFTSKKYDMPITESDVFIKALIDTFDKSEKKVNKDGFLELKISKERLDWLQELYKEYDEEV